MAYQNYHRRKTKKKRHGFLIFLAVLVLAAALAIGFGTSRYMRLSGQSMPWPDATKSFLHMVGQQISNLLPSSEQASIPLNSYDSSDFHQENGFVQCSASPVSVTGIDVSSHQGQIDWQTVANSGIQFAMIRVGFRGYESGTIQEDSSFYANIEGALAAGLDVGVYFYSQAVSTEEAREEAKFVLDHLGGYTLTYPVMFDWEENIGAERSDNMDSKTLTDCTIAFCDVIETYGYTAGFYFNQSFGYEQFDLKRLEAYSFWLAEYNPYPSFLYDVQMWQYSDQGTVPGIDTAVDLNLCFSTNAEKNTLT